MARDAASPRSLVNGEPGTAVDPTDRGFCLGDGLFETIAVRRGTPRFWERHLARLTRGCAALGIEMPPPSMLADEAERLIEAQRTGTLRLTVTRGPAPPGYAPPRDPRPTRVLLYRPGRPPMPAHPLRLCWCETRLSHQPRLAGLKHLSRLEQVLARAEWDDPEIDEGVMLDMDGHVVECTSANVFLVRDGELITPVLDRCGVAGVVREAVLETARAMGVPVSTRAAWPGELAEADEVFVTNASRGIAPVGRIGERRVAAPGPVTERLAAGIDWMEDDDDGT
jgi:4-amino-4-deoxychorismate lyase